MYWYNGKKHSPNIRLIFHCLCITWMAISMVKAGKGNEYDDETRFALAEVNRIFRRLFPLLPHKGSYLWTDNSLDYGHQIKSSSSNDQEPKKFPFVYSPHLSRANNVYGTESESTVGIGSKADGRMVDTSSLGQTSDLNKIETNVDPNNLNNIVDNNLILGNDQSRTSLDTDTSRVRTSESVLRKPTSSSKSSSWRPHHRKSGSNLGKRGPECMRKCIQQGVLHPVQCHSLC